MLQLIKQAPITVISLHELKDHLRLDHAHDDGSLEGIIQAATTMVEEYIGRSLLTKVWRRRWDCTANRNESLQEIPLPYPPVTAVESVVSLPDQHQRIPLRRYRVSRTDAGAFLEVYSRDPQLEITYRTGYGDYPGEVAPALRRAVLITAAEMYENRGDFSLEEHSALKALLHPYKVLRLG